MESKSESNGFRPGDIVLIADNWKDRPEDTTEYVILEWNIDRGFISPVRWQELGLSIKPVNLVTAEMIIEPRYP